VVGIVGLAGCKSLPGLSVHGLGSIAGGGDTTVLDDVTTGIETADMLGADPAGFRVTWIRWDSGFRGTDLRIGDRIIAVDGTRYVKPAKLEDLQHMKPRVVGGPAESQFWKDKGARDGTGVTLTVVRRAPSGVGSVTLEIKGSLRAQRLYGTGMQHTLGPGGPPELTNDGFDGAWASWYEKRTRDWEQVLDLGWTHQAVNSRVALKDHMEEKERVDYVVAHYPGPFAKTVAADWEKVRISLIGRAYRIGAHDLDYRSRGEKRAREVAAAAVRARQAFLAQVKAEVIPAFPAIDPIRGDRDAVAGKIVVLPEVGTRDWASQGGHAWLVAGGRGWYFVDAESPAVQRMFAAQYRYQKLVSPKLPETYAVIGRIKPTPQMLVVGGRAVTGLEVEPLAVTIGKAAFVDLRVQEGKASPFAGEKSLTVPSQPRLRDDSSPRQVMEAWIAALKAGDEATWDKLYAPWWAESWKGAGVIYRPFYPPPNLGEDWIRSRRLILDKVYDVRVIYVGNPRHVLTGKEFKGAPVIDEVTVEVDHVGKFDDGYHAFTSVEVHRQWLLQRRDGGPWRIASHQGI